MDYLRPIKTASFVLGFAMIFLAGFTNTVSLIFAGIGFFGLYSILLGSETIQRQHSLDPYTHDPFRKYREWGNIAQGIIFVTLGVVLISFIVSLYMGLSQTLIRFMVRRPGAILLALSLVCFLRAVNIFATSKIQTNIKGIKHLKNFLQWVEFFFSSLVPAGFMFFLGLFLLGAGVFEIASPNGFDKLGGSFIEIFFGGW